MHLLCPVALNLSTVSTVFEFEFYFHIFSGFLSVFLVCVSAIVIEGTEAHLAAKITQSIKVPTIGIGASPECTGQILVTEDIIGMFTEYRPSFVKHYGNVAVQIEQAIQNYATEVRDHKFPGTEHCFYN